MSDIVDQLAFVIKYGKLHAIPQEVVSKAAAEITHLRAENERLRGALVRICNWYPISVAKPRETITEIQQFAFAQLEKKK